MLANLSQVEQLAAKLPWRLNESLASARRSRESITRRIKAAEDLRDGRSSLLNVLGGSGRARSIIAELPDLQSGLARLEENIAAAEAALPLRQARLALVNVLGLLATAERNSKPIFDEEAEALPTATCGEMGAARYLRAKRQADKIRAGIEEARARLVPLVAAWRAARKAYRGQVSLEEAGVDEAIVSIVESEVL